MLTNRTRTPPGIAFWIILCAYLNCAGWMLSAIHRLNGVGYAVVLLGGAVFGLTCFQQIKKDAAPGFSIFKWKHRFARPFPMAFLILTVLTFVGGAIYAPTNYDALAYRIPRMLNWLAEGRWHWIHTEFGRLNTRGCGIEWISVPIIALSKTDRFLFLINTVSFLLLPGLVFSVFTRVGVRPRVAWYWMWIAPTGYCYLLQAGSISNDMFGSVFALAAIDFALRARKSGRLTDVCLSVLSASLLTSSKASNLPLLLPWFVAFVPTWRVWLKKPLAMTALIFPAVGASLIPTVVLNQLHCGDWTGLSAEPALIGGGPAWLHFFNNAVNYLIQNLVPPVFPFVSTWNHAADRMIPASLAPLLQKYFEPAAAHWRLGELQIEEAAGVGFGVTVLLGLSLLVGAFRKVRAKPAAGREGDLVLCLVCLAPWVGLFYTMTKLGLSSGARYLAPYYFLLMMGLLRGNVQAELVRLKWWRGGAYGVLWLALLLVVISPARPLWPAGWFIQNYESRLQHSALGSRALHVYGAFQKRSNAFEPVIGLLPRDASIIGMVTGDDPETSLWRPFGSRRIKHVLANESGDEIRSRGIKYVLVKEEQLRSPWEDWLKRVHGNELQTMDLKLRAEQPSRWHLVEIKAQ